MTRPFLIAGTALLAVAVSAALLAPARPDRIPGKRLTAKRPATKRASDPLDVLVAQLHRRFSDTRDVDFGFSRIARPRARMHSGPIMGRNDLVYSKDESDDEASTMVDPKVIRRTKAGGYEMRTERGTWISFDQARDQMRAENATERTAIAGLRAKGREVAIYTFGAFKDGRTNRWHGPAYLNQLGPAAPDSEALKTVAERAWAGERPTLPGYRLRAERVFAEASCVKCHSEMRATMTPTSLKGMSYRKGDALGLVMLAEKL